MIEITHTTKLNYKGMEIEVVLFEDGCTDYINAKTGELLLQLDADDDIFYTGCDVDSDFIDFIFER